MLSLADHQHHFLAALNGGPDHVLAGQFAGSAHRVMLAMKAHANGISHARLTAMEASFPRLRDVLGAAAFLALARRWTDTAAARALDSNHIGAGFANWLAAQGDDGARHAPLARLEWAWLAAYGAADARAMTMADLAGMAAQQVLDLSLGWHPATALVAATPELLAALPELTDVVDGAVAIAVVRPGHDVRLVPLDAAAQALLAALTGRSRTIGNLFAALLEHGDDSAVQGALVQLIEAGALMPTREEIDD